MSLAIYGSTQCAACKTVLSMAKAQNVPFTYRQIDTDSEALEAFTALVDDYGISRQLPVATHPDSLPPASGVSECMTLLRTLKG